MPGLSLRLQGNEQRISEQGSAGWRVDEAGDDLHGFHLAGQESVGTFDAWHMQAFGQYATDKGNGQRGRASGQRPCLVHQAVDTLANKTGTTINSAARLRGLLP